MHWAASLGNVAAVGTLSDMRASMEAKAKTGTTPFLVVVEQGHVQVLKALADLGADLSYTSNNGETPMHFAAQSGDPYLIHFLASLGAKPIASRQAISALDASCYFSGSASGHHRFVRSWC